MILYKILVAHYGPKDNHRSIEGYIVRENEERAFEHVISLGYHGEESLAEEHEVYNDDYEVVGTETLREKLLRLGGDYFDPDCVGRSDLYYGHTEYGWEEVKEVTEEEIKVLQDCGILEAE
jgi:hypothetical protein